MTEELKLAAQVVIEHLRSYGPNARVVILAPDFTIMRDVALEGEHGLLKLYGKEFSPSALNMTQFNHEGGGQVLQMAPWQASIRMTGQIYTCVWAENPDKASNLYVDAVKLARGRIINGIFVQSSGGIVVNLQEHTRR